MRGWWNMACWNGLSPEQQQRLIKLGNLEIGYEPEGECTNGAEVCIEVMDDEAPGPRFYCRACAVDYLNVCVCSKVFKIRGHWSMDELHRVPIPACPVHRFTEPLYLDEENQPTTTPDKAVSQ